MPHHCEKEVTRFTGVKELCGEVAIFGVRDSAGQEHWYCGDHLWEASPNTDPTKTCDMLGANSPSLERCDRPAVVKHTSPVGEEKYWCERCRRKWFPTDAEKAEDLATEQRIAASSQRFGWVLTAMGWVLKAAFGLLCLYGLVAFIKWCWIHS
jgi:hypothetical protein